MLTGLASAHLVEVVLRNHALLVELVHALLGNEGFNVGAHNSVSHIHSHRYLYVLLSHREGCIV